MKFEKILITGASGQLGYVLTKKLQEHWGLKNVIASDLRISANFKGCFEILDATNFNAVRDIVLKHQITQVYHLAAILSANGEKTPLESWNTNMQMLFNVLEVSKLENVKKIFYPSSIAVFGENLEKENVPQSPNLTPSTVYGMSKLAGENWGNYYHQKYGLDIRSIRYPGIIGHQSLPGGGTTDYAVYIYHNAVKHQDFECFLNAKTTLPMIYMDDAIRATIEIMEAPIKKISIRTSYNIAGMSFNPEQIFESIKTIYPNFKIYYKPDFRQNIADSWPRSIDDSLARNDWNWKPKYSLESMTTEMIENLNLRIQQ